MRKRPNPFPDCETVEAIAAGVCEDLDPEHGPDGGYWYVRDGSVWQSQHRVVALHPEWFVPLGQGQTTPAYMPGRAA